MTKKELIKKIEDRFVKGARFFKWLGYKNPYQAWHTFKKSRRVDLGMVRVLEILDELDRLKELIK